MGLLLLWLIAAALAALAVVQADFEPSLYAPPVFSPAPASSASQGSPALLSGLAPPGWTEAGPAEAFTPATLYQKIDGAADLYLAAGFHDLACRRYASADGARTLQGCAYRMADADAAWAVFSRQRRADAQAIELGRAAYRTPNALYLVQGTAYVEVVGADDASDTRAAVEAFARAFAGAELPAEVAPAVPPLPPLGLVADSVRRVRGGAFGFSAFDDLTTGAYAFDGAAATAFWAERSSTPDAEALAKAYAAYLLANGATRSPADLGVPGAAAFDVLGTTEAVVVAGRVVLGVHEADTPAVASTLLKALVAAAPATGEVQP